MNKNHREIKNTFSNIRPSDECIERVMDMTNERNKNSSEFLAKRLVPVALALAILVGGGFGINSLTGRHENEYVSPAGYSIGGLMTVEAKDELTGSVNADMGYRIYTKNITGLSDKEIEQERIHMAKLWLCGGDEEMIPELKSDEFTLKGTLKSDIHTNGNVIYATDRGMVEESITICGVDDPSTVKDIRITNTSSFGYPIMEADDLYFTEKEDGTFVYDNIGVDTSKTSIAGHDVSLSGERYYQCRRIENPQATTYAKESFDKESPFYGLELSTGKIFYIIYEFSDNFYDYLGENPDYDFTSYDDEMTVVVEFKNGKTAENKLAVKIDENGNVYCKQKSYSYN